MSRLFEELDYQPTPIGAVSLRRRRELTLNVDIYEIKLDDEFLMSSLYTASEVALAERALALLADAGHDALTVVVGGLGLGYTAKAVLDHAAVDELLVVEQLAPVIAWHRRGLVPLGSTLADAPRCRLVEADFFACAAHPAGFDPTCPGRRFDAILLDIDHSPEAWLDARSAAFYGAAGLTALAGHLRPGGVFGLWSNEPPDATFTARLAAVFASAVAAPVEFRDPVSGRDWVQAVYLARSATEDAA
ncbi:MAG: spermidine synthase [Gammaproteobacteria bacterium]